jgi:pyruvate dehydrogenase E2 component (dihydrolipoamide acetyltransferase)
MIKEIIMPKLGETMEEGTITKWLKKEGDKVEKGEPIVEVMTDKANFEVESPAAGFLRSVVFPASEKPVPVIKVIGYVTDSMDEKLPEIKEETKSVPAAPDIKPAVHAETVKAAAFTGIKASPVAKKLAIERGVDLSKVKGSGPGGRIVEKDIPEDSGEAIPLTGIRKIIAERMSKSKREIPHYYLQTEIDMTEAAKKKTRETSYNDMIVRATAKVLEEFPNVNTLFENNRIKPQKKINIGIAVGMKNGLVVPVIKDANKKSLKEISEVAREIRGKAKKNSFTPDDFSSGTFTISNLGGYDIDTFIAIINPPQVAILAVGKIKEVPEVINGEIQVRKMMKVCGSFDHRVVDGAQGANFLYNIKKMLEVNYEQL